MNLFKRIWINILNKKPFCDIIPSKRGRNKYIWIFFRDVLGGEKNKKEKWKMVLELIIPGNSVKSMRHIYYVN